MTKCPISMSERRQITIHGFVQGVFFRETVRQIAQRHPVAGFVRNVGRDRVQIEAEGEPAELGELSVASATGERSFIVAPTVRG
jgi:acylphosphatase